MPARVKLNFSYKGNRDYIQGPSFYEAVTQHLLKVNPKSLDGSFHMTMHEFSRSRCDFLYRTDSVKMERQDRGCVEISSFSGLYGWLVETDEAITTRVPFPEQEIVDQCRVENKCIITLSNMRFLPIEVLVSMTKCLHQTIFSSEKGKWLFTRLDLDRLLVAGDVAQLRVKLLHNIGARLTKSAIYSREDLIGYIYFSSIHQ